MKREICAVTSRGTRVFGIQDGEPIDAGSTNYLLAICEEVTLVTSSAHLLSVMVDSFTS